MESKFELIVDAFLSAGYTPQEYSGRMMYGSTCLGVECADPIRAVLEMVSALAVELDDAMLVQEVVPDLYESRTDSMGRNQIVYWPSIKWEADAHVDAMGCTGDDEPSRGEYLLTGFDVETVVALRGALSASEIASLALFPRNVTTESIEHVLANGPDSIELSAAERLDRGLALAEHHSAEGYAELAKAEVHNARKMLAAGDLEGAWTHVRVSLKHSLDRSHVSYRAAVALSGVGR